MADGTFAVIMLVAGLTDMVQDYCGTPGGCLARVEVEPRISVAGASWVPRTAQQQGELYVRYDLNHRYGPFGNAVGVSVAEAGETWIGIGQTYAMWDHARIFGELHAMTGLYFANGGYDLGHMVEFRSGIEIGYITKNGWRFGLGYDHRSNTGAFADLNPGVETVHLRVSIPLN